MNTLAELKRFLKEGVTLKMTNAIHNRLVGKKRRVVKTQSNGVYFIDPDDATSKKSFFSFPKASLLEIDGNKIKIFETGKRSLTTAEKAIKDGYEKIRNKKLEEIDIVTDGSQSYWQERKYYYNKNAIYLMGTKSERGMVYDYKTNMVRDDKVKGEMSLEYEVLSKG